MKSYREIMDSQRRSWNPQRGDPNDQFPSRSAVGSSECDDETAQTHTHEFEASTMLAEEGQDRHNHRFAGVTSEVIPISGGNHKHTILTLTDFFGHLHEVAIETGPAIDVGNGKHIHFVKGQTTFDDGHSHEFEFVTQIQSPLLH